MLCLANTSTYGFCAASSKDFKTPSAFEFKDGKVYRNDSLSHLISSDMINEYVFYFVEKLPGLQSFLEQKGVTFHNLTHDKFIQISLDGLIDMACQEKLEKFKKAQVKPNYLRKSAAEEKKEL